MIDVHTLLFFFSADFIGDLYHFGVETFHVISWFPKVLFSYFAKRLHY